MWPLTAPAGYEHSKGPGERPFALVEELPVGYCCRMSGHQDQAAAEARREVKERAPGESQSQRSYAGDDPGYRRTGEVQAARNREQDPPA